MRSKIAGMCSGIRTIKTQRVSEVHIGWALPGHQHLFKERLFFICSQDAVSVDLAKTWSNPHIQGRRIVLQASQAL